MAVEFDRICGMISDSPIPLLALVEGCSAAKSFTLWFTPEKKSKVPYLKRFFESKHPKTKFKFVQIPSMNEPAKQVQALKEEIAGQSEGEDLRTAVFISAGTTTMALSMWYHSKAQTWITLRRGLELSVFSPQDGQETCLVLGGGVLTLQQILFSQGWIYNGRELQHENGKLSETIEVSYSESTGELSFVKNVQNLNDSSQERAVSFMCALTDEFGFNGANYEIHGSLSKRALNLLNDAIIHTKGEGEEE